MYSYSMAFKQNHYNCLEEKIVLLIDSAKIAEREGPSHHPSFMGNCPAISHRLLALSTQWMSSPSRD